MKIALIGYGGMGRAVARVAAERGHEVAVIVDPSASEAGFKEVTAEALAGMDVVIDFSLGGAVLKNLHVVHAVGVPLVVGATGWYDRLDEARKLVESGSRGGGGGGVEAPAGGGGIPFLWSSNFSIGVNLYFRVVEAAARMMDKFEEYDVWGHEIHHVGKADSPSGTAKSLEKILLDSLARKSSVVEDKLDRRRADDEIHFSSVRGGVVNFGHTIGFDSAADRILLTHEARSRDGYALGAVKAAEWLVGKPAGWYGMKDFLGF